MLRFQCEGAKLRICGALVQCEAEAWAACSRSAIPKECTMSGGRRRRWSGWKVDDEGGG